MDQTQYSQYIAKHDQNHYPQAKSKVTSQSMVSNYNQKQNLKLNSSHSNLSNFLAIKQQELESKMEENCSLNTELEKVEEITTLLQQQRFGLIDQISEKKAQFALLKKEIEVKKAYISSLVRSNKNKIFNDKQNIEAHLEALVRKINDTTSNINNSHPGITNNLINLISYNVIKTYFNLE